MNNASKFEFHIVYICRNAFQTDFSRKIRLIRICEYLSYQKNVLFQDFQKCINSFMNIGGTFLAL